MINIRKRLSGLFDQASHNIVYIRRDLRFKCDCYSERSGEPRAGCPKCFGTGYVVSIEKKRTRRQISSVPETLVGLNKLHSFGSVVPKAYVYYLEHDVRPQENDLILEVGWDAQGVPRIIQEKHLISVVAPMRGYKGRIEFYQVYCRYDHKGEHDDKALTEH